MSGVLKYVHPTCNDLERVLAQVASGASPAIASRLRRHVGIAGKRGARAAADGLLVHREQCGTETVLFPGPCQRAIPSHGPLHSQASLKWLPPRHPPNTKVSAIFSPIYVRYSSPFSALNRLRCLSPLEIQVQQHAAGAAAPDPPGRAALERREKVRPHGGLGALKEEGIP